MKLKTLLATLFVAGLVVSMAVAAPAERGKGKGKNGTTAASTTEAVRGKGKKKGHAKHDCKPRRAVVLVGDFAGAESGSFAMLVKGGNKAGKALAGKQVTVTVTDGTKIRRSGKATLAELATGDLLLVQGHACKLDSQALTLVARKVVVLSPTDDEDTTTTTTTTDSTTTSTVTTSSTTTTS
jgi:hypothetical protein